MSELFTFLLSAAAISLTGVMGPGPVTAATLAAGARHRHAGFLMAIGHAIVEVPLVLLIVMGLGHFFQMEGVKITIGLAGGGFLAVLGFQMLGAARRPPSLAAPVVKRSTLTTGIVLTACNPYFLLWWATVGLALATQASQLGLLAFALFGLVHWLCDLVWLEILSQASYRGARIFSEKSQQVVFAVCAIALLFFAAKFLLDALGKLVTR